MRRPAAVATSRRPCRSNSGVPEAFLETQEALTEGGLADVEAAGGRGQRAVLAEGVQQLQVADVHIHKHTLERSIEDASWTNDRSVRRFG